ncbi:MAG: hypothetical protein QOF51_1088, partial [Chloroflexota bacterium]|jgi:polyisoprenoid-binding protein YceI|nr:hypothetical protein [Chloroflexota bacterium]
MGWELDESHSQVTFAAYHMGLATVHGVFTAFDAAIEFDAADVTRSSVAATIDATSLSTFNQRRDDEVKGDRYLDTAAYPTITFKGARIEQRGDRYAIIGDLTMRGVTRQVELDTIFNGEAVDGQGRARCGFSGTASISRYDFGIRTSPVDAIVRFPVERVDINIDIELIKK